MLNIDNTKTMSFKVSGKNLLEKYTKIWKRLSNLLNIKFDSEPAFGDNDKYIKTKIKIHENKVNNNFQGKKIPKENTMFIISNVRLYSQIKKTYHPQTLLEEWKYEIKKPKMENLIDDELESSSSEI